eukprot:g293.t1
MPRTPSGEMMPPPRCPAKTSPKESPRLKMSPKTTPQGDGLQPAAQMPTASSGVVGDAALTAVGQTLSGTGGLPAAATPREPQQEQEGTAPTAGTPQTPGRASSDMKQAQRLVKRLVAQRSAPGSRRLSGGSGAAPQHQFKQRRGMNTSTKRTTGRLPDHVYVDLAYRVRKREVQFVKLKGEPEGEPRGPPAPSGAPPDDAVLQDATKTAHSLCGDVEEGAAGALLHQGLIAEGAAGQEALTTEQPAQGAEGFALPHFFPSEEQQTKEAKKILLALCDTIPAEEYGKTPFGAVFPDGRVEIEAKERFTAEELRLAFLPLDDEFEVVILGEDEAARSGERKNDALAPSAAARAEAAAAEKAVVLLVAGDVVAEVQLEYVVSLSSESAGNSDQRQELSLANFGRLLLKEIGVCKQEAEALFFLEEGLEFISRSAFGQMRTWSLLQRIRGRVASLVGSYGGALVRADGADTYGCDKAARLELERRLRVATAVGASRWLHEEFWDVRAAADKQLHELREKNKLPMVKLPEDGHTNQDGLQRQIEFLSDVLTKVGRDSAPGPDLVDAHTASAWHLDVAKFLQAKSKAKPAGLRDRFAMLRKMSEETTASAPTGAIAAATPGYEGAEDEALGSSPAVTPVVARSPAMFRLGDPELDRAEEFAGARLFNGVDGAEGNDSHSAPNIAGDEMTAALTPAADLRVEESVNRAIADLLQETTNVHGCSWCDAWQPSFAPEERRISSTSASTVGSTSSVGATLGSTTGAWEFPETPDNDGEPSEAGSAALMTPEKMKQMARPPTLSREQLALALGTLAPGQVNLKSTSGEEDGGVDGSAQPPRTGPGLPRPTTCRDGAGQREGDDEKEVFFF